MQDSCPAPELRSPRSQIQDLRRETAYLEATVATALVLSICTLVLALTDWSVSLARTVSALA
jgi:hypothetical protein